MSFLLMWTSVFASGFGDRLIQLAALPLLGANAPGASAADKDAAITFFFFLPYLFIVIPGGWLADHLPRKWMMLACDEGRAFILLMAAMWVPATFDASQPIAGHEWKVYTIIVLVGTLAAVFNPVRNAIIPQIVATSQLQRANAMIFGIAIIGSLIGFMLGSKIVNESLRHGLLLGMLLFLVSGTFFAFLKPVTKHRLPEIEKRKSVGSFTYIKQHKRVIQLMLLFALIWAVAYFLNVAVTALCKQRFEFTDGFLERISYLKAAAGIGMLVSAGFIAWLNLKKESHWVMMIALACGGFSAILVALSPNYTFALIFTFGVGFFGYVGIVGSMTLLQLIVPNYIRGRVFAVLTLLSVVSAVIVNLAVWRMGESADIYVLWCLAISGLVLIVIAMPLAYRMLTTGPMPNRLGNAIWHTGRAYLMVWHRVRWIGHRNIPQTGPLIIASNHTTGLDPMLLQAPHTSPVRFVMLTSYQSKWLAPVWKALDPIALDLDGRDTNKLRAIGNALKAGDIIGIFPEGRLQRDHRRLFPFQRGVGMLAQRSKAPILPAWISGTPIVKRMHWHFITPSKSVVVFGKVYQPDPNWTRDELLEDLKHRLIDLARSIGDDPEMDDGRGHHHPASLSESNEPVSSDSVDKTPPTAG